jgi:phosphoglycerate dehydrogenase-like enzyme
VHSPSAGVEKYLGTADAVEPGIERLIAAGDIVLTNARRCYGPNIADQAFAYLLSFTSGVKEAIEGLEGQAAASGGGGAESPLWARVGRGKRPAIELRGKTLLVVGVGGIGGQVAERARGFGMRVIGIDPEPAAVARAPFPVHPPGKLLDLLPRADAVVVACPLTSASKGMFGKAQFDAMKDGAYFINVARGRIVDQEALAAALRGGKLAGAGLDVTEPEPLPDASPLWGLENVIITPHNAGQYDGSKRRGKLLTRENIRRFAAGEPLLNVVDKAKGY